MTLVAKEQDLLRILNDYERRIYELERKQNLSLDFVTSLPSDPFDRQEVLYVVDASTIWRFKFRSSVNKWHFIGGPPLLATAGPDYPSSQSTTSDSYTDLTTAGPSLTVPLAGDYDLYVACPGMFSNTAATYCSMSVDIGGAGAAFTEAIQGGYGNSAFETTSHIFRRTLAAVTLTAKYRRHGTTTASFYGKRTIAVTPVRLDDV